MKYTVRYTETNWIEREVEASSQQEAEDKMMEMVCSGEVDLADAELEDCKCVAFNAEE